MEGNCIGLVSEYVTKAKGTKMPSFALPKESKEASKLYGMDFVDKDKSVTQILDKN